MPPQPPAGPSSKRYPLANAVNHQALNQHPHYNPMQQQQLKQHNPPTPPPKAVAGQEGAKAPSSPPLPRQNSKTRPPSPPKVISDKGGRLFFNRVGFLGEGGFARVYEVQDPRGTRLACKVVTKSALKTKKAKTKLYAEIKIHRSLDHPNIVTFQDCFEDDDNVYITLDLCRSGSLMDLLRRRRRFTEAETRFFMVQLIGACHYMHTHQVIHRDLKLGNLFLDHNMNVQVGDFGLAALIENPGERKKTICGTPNYIAPEVLFDTANGHSFEVDVWSIGVILYTLVIGRPPFQTKEVKEIYKRIRDNEYDFPTDRSCSSAVKHLIQQILTPDPSERPTLHEIIEHPFFTQGPVPASVPQSAHDGPPDFKGISRRESEANLKRLRRSAWLDDDGSEFGVTARATQRHQQQQQEYQQQQQQQQNAADAARGDGREGREGGGRRGGNNITTSIAQQEKEFQKAVQPGSPISALLSSARQPLLVGPSSTGPLTHRESPLLRKLQAAAPGTNPHARGQVGESPLGRRSVTRGADGVVKVNKRADAAEGEDEEEDEEEVEARQRKKELEQQKARIVAQMAPVKEEDEEDDGEEMEEDAEEQEAPAPPPKPVYRHGHQRTGSTQHLQERENLAPGSTVRMVQSRQQGQLGVKASASTTRLPSSGAVGQREREREHREREQRETKEREQREKESREKDSAPALKLNGFDAAAQTLTLAFEAKSAGRVFRPLRVNSEGELVEAQGEGDVEEDEIPDEKVFIVSWVDYCNKYGMGYALTDGSVGVHFNDSTSLVLSGDKQHFDYIASRRGGAIYVRKSYTTSEYPEELKSKVYLLKHFEKYIMERLYGEYEYTYVDTERKKGMDWVQKYLRMKHVIVFKLSHDVLQFNFYDHSKLILSSQGQLVTHIDKHYRMTRWKLRDIMSFALNPPSNADQEQLKFNQRLVDKLKYCKEVLLSIKNASASGTGEDGQEGGPMELERPQPAQGGRAEQAAPARVPPQQTTLGRSRHAGSKMSLR
ncbi:hypothetical protein EST38_g7293 [Candolleomyces aberdarensis]|uniref:Serine/threonine-protein kinase n=1 Tax=Candolleomyces aberdarensis TaxID=2316362 RepID=A0A4V1Q3H0_9AGAR|nr:hypothetical protein EST38_g7293 [Candolleomyces aberdarensis]